MKQAVCALIVKGDLVLGVSRKDDPTDFGLPGGKVEDDESLLEALHREVLEETGLVVTGAARIFSAPNHDFDCVTFWVDVEGEIGSDENGVVAWVDPQTLKEGSFGDYNTALFDVVTARASYLSM